MIFLNKYIDFARDVLNHNWVKSIVVITVAVLVYKLINMLLLRGEMKKRKHKVGHKDKTYIRLIRNFMKYAFFIVVLFIILQINGIDVSSMIAGVGILSIIIGFIVQDAFKDIIRGIDIISDNYFVVGDVVKYGEIEGKVIMVGLKTTKIEDIRTSNIVSIANRNIEQIEVVSKDLFINIPLPYDVKVENAEEVINEIVDLVKVDSRVDECLYKGVNNFKDSFIEYLINIKVNPREKLAVRRDTLGIILEVLDKHEIEIPFTQIDIHNK
jgi:small conductance mechanosensitive channel